MQSANYDSPVTVQGNSSGEAIPVTATLGTGASAAQIQGTVAEDSAVANNPVPIGVEARSTSKTSVTSGDVVRPVASVQGVLASVQDSAMVDGSSNTIGAFIADDGVLLRGIQVNPMVYNRVSATWDRASGGISASGTFTPAASSHTAGDVNGAAATFDLNAPPSSVFEIQSVSLMIETGTIETTAWTLHLYSVTPPSALADDSVWDIPSGDRASYLGSLAIAQVVDVGATLYIEAHNYNKRVQLAASGDLFGYLVNGTTLTTQAVAHTIKLIGKVV